MSPSIGDPAQLVEPPQVEDRVRRLAELAGQGDHQVGAAGDRAAPGRPPGSAYASASDARAGDGRFDRHRRSAARRRMRDRPTSQQDQRRDDPEPDGELLRRERRPRAARQVSARRSSVARRSVARRGAARAARHRVRRACRWSAPRCGRCPRSCQASVRPRRAIASTILVYPVQRHRLPAIASRIASSSGPPPASR